MSHRKHGLGGRLALLEPASLQAKQRELYDELTSRIAPWADAAGFRSKDEQGHAIGPFNAMLLSPEMGSTYLAWQKTEEQYSSLSKRAREVVILTVGSVWQASYELYAHSAVAAKAGLTSTQIEALVAGRNGEGLSEDEVAAQRFTHQLTSKHVVDDETYAVAYEAFGDRGLMDMVTLIGCYLTVCALLNAFIVPVPRIQTTARLEESC